MPTGNLLAELTKHKVDTKDVKNKGMLGAVLAAFAIEYKKAEDNGESLSIWDLSKRAYTTATTIHNHQKLENGTDTTGTRAIEGPTK